MSTARDLHFAPPEHQSVVGSVVVNGTDRRISRGPSRSLLYVLREELGLTGAKYGCGEGVCGACTVLVDGAPMRACITPIETVTGEVTTIEGLSTPALGPVQRAFVELDAMQCGFCTPAMIVVATALLREDPSPSDAAIVRALDGNVCRCCAYVRIVRAVRRAAELLQTERNAGTA